MKNKLSIILVVAILLLSTGITTANYQPDNLVTYEELIQISATNFNLDTTDQQNLFNWLDHLTVIKDSPGNEQHITRMELVAVASNLLGLTDQSIDVSDWQQTFTDIPKDHPFFAAIELINQLNVIPSSGGNQFEPSRLATRAEVGALLDAIVSLESVNGQVVEVLQPAERVVVTTDDGQYRSLPVEASTLILRNGQVQQLQNIAVGDQVNALYDLSGNVAYVNVEQSANNQNQILQTVSGLVERLQNVQGIDLDSLASNENVQDGIQEGLQALQQLVTPEQLVAIISGDWTTVGEGFSDNLYLQLTELGLTPWEAEALLTQDWNRLGDMGMDRVAIVLSDYIGITPEIFYSAINQNWDQLLEYAQVEIAQRLISGLSF